MSLAQRFAQVFGGIYLLVGILGFIPPLLVFGLPGDVGGPFAGFLLGLFVVNWFANLVHLLIGAGGLATYRNPGAANIYALVVGVVCAVLVILGIIFSLRFLGGLLPLNRWDHGLHLLTALIAFGAYFASRGEPAHPTGRRMYGDSFIESRAFTLILLSGMIILSIVGLLVGSETLLQLALVFGAGTIAKVFALGF